ncbi:MAG TPA: hypothetical protein VIF57_12015 [Polyangia bacterium]|jgi:hypothetical protein
MRAARLAAAAATVIAALGAWPVPAAADAGGAAAPTNDGLTLNMVGACPDEDAVRRILAGLLSTDEARTAPISVQDRGPRFRVAVRDAATMIDDPGRDCAARARQAAALAAAELQRRQVVFGPPTFTIEKGVVFETTSTSDGLVWAPGAEFRGAFGSKPWSLVGSAGARGPVTLPLANGWKAEMLRFPLDAGARLTTYRWGRLRPWVVVGGSLTVTGIIGRDVVQTDREWRLDLGAIAMAGATLRMFGRIGGMAALVVRWQPRPYELQVIPAGDVGETPRWWVGLSLNYTLDGKGSTPP